MAEGQLLSSKDARRLQNMLRDYEHGTLKPKYRRRGGGGGGGGTQIYKAFCKTDAPKSIIIACYSDEYIKEIPDNWEAKYYYVNDYVTGTNGKVYCCTVEHNAISSTCPITGENWANVWELAEIDVHCTIASQPKSIEVITLSNPISIKITAHGFVTGVTVRLMSIIGITPSLDGEYVITKVDVNNFTLNGTNSSGYAGGFVSGTACGVDLDESIPRLTSGLEIPVWKDGDIWKCFWGFEHWEPYKEICP